MVNKKMSRAISVLAVLAMLAMLIPVAVFADNTVAISQVGYDSATDLVTAKGTISAEGADITMMAIRSNAPLDEIPGNIAADDIMYVDQQTVGADKSYTWTFKPRDTVEGSYITVFMGGTDVSTYVEDYVKLTGAASGVEAPAWIDNSNSADSWTISIPADTDEVTYSVTVDGVDSKSKVEDGVLTVARNDEGGADIIVVVTASTVAEPWSFTVSAKQAAPAITAENVSIINSKAYGQTGKTLIAVTVGADIVNPETASMTIGDAKLYYSPVKAKYYAVADAEYAADEATIALNIAVDPATPSETVYFGVTSIGATRTKQNPADFSITLNKYLMKPVTLSDKQFIAMDAGAAELDGKFNPTDFAALLNLYLMKTNALPVNVQ